MSNMFLNIFLIELQVFTKKTTYFYGTPGANRTRDLWLRRPTLYPLSYGRKENAGLCFYFFIASLNQGGNHTDFSENMPCLQLHFSTH